MALSQTSSSQMICVLTGLRQVILESQSVMNAVDGATIEWRIRISRPDDENTRCRDSRVRVQPKDFSQRTQPLTTLLTSSVISPQQERTEPSGPRRCRRGAKSSLRREPNMPAYLLRALFGNVTVPGRHLSRCFDAVSGGFQNASGRSRVARASRAALSLWRTNANFFAQ